MRLKTAFMHNPRIEPLLDGTIKTDGLEFDWQLGHPATQFRHHLAENSCDLFEFSISDYMAVRDRPECAHLRWTAIPIFLQKAFLIFGLHANVRSGIRGLGDLKGKRVGLPDYPMAAGVWLRLLLRQLHGIHPADITWYNGRPRSKSHASVYGLDETPPPGITIVKLEEGMSLNDMLARGEVDIAFGDSQTVPITEGPEVRQLFSSPEQCRQLIVDFCQRTGTTPINHVLLAQEDLLAQNGGLATKVYDAFERSKQEAYRRAAKEAQRYLLFPQAEFARQAAVFGEDPFPSGLSANRSMLEMVADELLADGLVRQRPDIDSLLPEELRNT